MADILDVYFREHIKKGSEPDEFFWNICKVAFAGGERKRMEPIFEKIIEYYLPLNLNQIVRFTRNANHELSQLLADSYFEKQLYSQAYVMTGLKSSRVSI